MKREFWVFAILVISILMMSKPSIASCGHLVRIKTVRGGELSYVLSSAFVSQPENAIVFVLLTGGDGQLDFNKDGCPRKSPDSGLLRMTEGFNKSGFITALVDTKKEFPETTELGGLRLTRAHANDIGRVVLDIRTRLGRPIWLVGMSRGTLSAVNAAASLVGSAGPDGLILLSPTLRRGRFNMFTLMDLALESIRSPFLMIGSEHDACQSSDNSIFQRFANRTRSIRHKEIVLSGYPEQESGAVSSLHLCRGDSPHGFLKQEAEVVKIVNKFVRSPQ